MAATAETKVFDENVADDAVLEKFGYEPELKRTFGMLGMIGFSFSIVTCWTALSGVLIVGVESGGPPVMIWSWVGVCAVSLAVAYSMAEMCSAYPVAGGQYSWVAILAPKRWARGLSYVCGWFMLIGILAMGAVNNFIGANFLLGMANLTHPEYTIERWHTVLVTYLICSLATLSNIFLPHLLNRISKAILLWNICSFFVCFITILATNDHKQSASFVFSDFQNSTGFNKSYTAILGILQSAFGMCCYDAPAHMTEEIKDARKQAPRAIVMSVWLGFVTGFVFLISLCFCMGSIEETAASPTGVPVIAIFYNSTGSIGGATALASLITVIVLVCANSLMAEGGRAVYAFARDQVYAILVTGVVQAAFNSIYFGTVTGFNTVISIATEGFYVSYAIPLFVRILSRVMGEKRQQLEGPYSLGRWGLLANVVGFVYLAFAVITFNFPTVNPVDEENMNYTSAAVGVVMVIAIVTWFTTGRKHYSGPETGAVMEGVERKEEGAQVVADTDEEKKE
ncbi:putative gaba permease protein [Neofusicoccum parvum]|uniref:Gaba permease protein n=2 Tax=Neofusicoccum parvum TaxID=310453 RepID=A0ACB5RQM9_9PEZI|nr:putative gaba permease protein [Neofusicoccum parvum UCRNP2]GME22793.1 putative gaba permease protein [Neofusicoccum parvum]GME45448.1 putative gaba permease protein [Neofusicoccum parvum]